MAAELERIATMCDGVRCDMAMLVLPEVFERTWGLHASAFWPDTIARVIPSTRTFFSWRRFTGTWSGTAAAGFRLHLR